MTDLIFFQHSIQTYTMRLSFYTSHRCTLRRLYKLHISQLVISTQGRNIPINIGAAKVGKR